MTLSNPLTAPLWKLATIGAGVVCLVLSALLLSSTFENRSLVQQRNALALQITDPNTGFVARLAQANTNVETYKTALETQRKSFEAKAAEREAVLADTQQRLEAAQATSRAMQLKLDRFLATKPQGSTLDERVRDIDRRALSELVQ